MSDPTPPALTRYYVPRNLRDDGMIEASEVAHYTHLNLVEYVKVSDLKDAVEGLRTNIARSFINTDEISAYRLACEHILAQLAPEGE